MHFILVSSAFQLCLYQIQPEHYYTKLLMTESTTITTGATSTLVSASNKLSYLNFRKPLSEKHSHNTFVIRQEKKYTHQKTILYHRCLHFLVKWKSSVETTLVMKLVWWFPVGVSFRVCGKVNGRSSILRKQKTFA